MFCPKCGSLLIPKKVNNKKVVACSCGYKSKKADDIKIQETSSKKETDEKKFDVVEHEKEAYPLTEEECEKCGHRKAYFWTVQTRAGDEAETKFFKCEKCKHVWRDYN